MKATVSSLPVITIDNTLVKSTAERNKGCSSEVGTKFDLRTPARVDLDPLPVRPITPIEEPKDSNKVDWETPLEKLLEPKQSLLRTPEEIDGWWRKNYYRTNRPTHYVGHEANVDDPSLYDDADARILVIRMSPYDAVNGSLTHGALAQIIHMTAEMAGKKAYVDFSYMPSLMVDCKLFSKEGIPWWFGRTSKRHPLDFDLMIMSFALTMEAWNAIPGLINSGISPFKTQRDLDAPIGEKEPLILFGGVVSDNIEALYGKVGEHECVPDGVVIGDGEHTLAAIVEELVSCKERGRTKREFLRSCHDLAKGEHFERDPKPNEEWNWFLEPDLYEPLYEDNEKTGYRELSDVVRKPGCEYATKPGHLKRAVMRDLNKTPIWEESPVMYDGSLGPSVDIQISSGCLSGGLCSFCLTGDTEIATVVDDEIKLIPLRDLEWDSEVELMTPWGPQTPEGIWSTGVKKVVKVTTARGHTLRATPDHKIMTHIGGEIVLKPIEELIPGDKAVFNPSITRDDVDKGDRDFIYPAVLRPTATENQERMGRIKANEKAVQCITGDALIETDMGFESIRDAFERLEDEDELGGCLVQTRHGLKAADGIVSNGKRMVREYVFVEEDEGDADSEPNRFTITCTDEHKFAACVEGDSETDWIEASDLEIGQEVWAVDYESWKASVDVDGRTNIGDQFYYNSLSSVALYSVSEPYEEEVWDVVGVDEVDEYIANGLIVHNSNNISEENARWREPFSSELCPEQADWFRALRRIQAYTDPIVSIEPDGEEEVFDVWNIEKGHVFFANGMVVSNCHEASTQGRWRERSLEYIQEASERAIRKQGASQTSFYSLTWSLHSQVYSLMLWNYKRFGNTNLISQRADQSSADPNFFQFQNAHGEKSCTVGVEGLSQRMRNYYNKSLNTEQLIRACENAANADYTSIKWFMILSGMETDEDIEEFCDLLRDLKRRFNLIAKRISKETGTHKAPTRLNLSFMLLLNLQHTALQWGPCASSRDLDSDILRPVVECCKECGFGFRASMTRDRVRLAQWSSLAGRESTELVAETGMRAGEPELRTGFVYFGPIPKRVSWVLDKLIDKSTYDWEYFLREKNWEHVFPWDYIATPMRRDYLWNQWRRVRENVGVSYCLKTSVNSNPKCSDCGACGTASDRSFMLTRELETPDLLHGKEDAKRDMTVRKRVRWLVDVYEETLRVVPKDVLARNLVRAFMLTSSEKIEFNNEMILSYLYIDGTSLKYIEGAGNLPWVGRQVLVDLVFNQNFADEQLRALIPDMNKLLWGMKIYDFVANDKLSSFGKDAFALYQITLPTVSHFKIEKNLQKFNELESVKLRKKVTAGRGMFRMQEVTKTVSDTVPLALTTLNSEGKTVLTWLNQLRTHPLEALSRMIDIRGSLLKPFPVECLGYYRYDRERVDDSSQNVEDGDIWAALEGRSLYCEVTGEPIETDLFTGELYRSKTAPDLCLAADLKGVVKMQQDGVNLTAALVGRK